MKLFAVTGAGLVRIEEEKKAWTVEVLRRNDHMQCVALDPVRPGTLYVGSQKRGVWKSTDEGTTWQDLQLPERDVFSLAVSPADGSLYAGTEPSRLFKSTDAGNSWRELEGLQRLPSRPTWSFPPRPWTSHVRWIAPHPQDAEVLLVGIELGGLMRSTDGGETWIDHRPGAQKDVHALAWHPHAPAYAYEAGGGGAAWSKDGGETWQAADAGRDRHYVWGLATCASNPETWFVSASPSANHAHSRENAQAVIYRWRGGGPWEALSDGLPTPLESMPYALLNVGDFLFAGLGDGTLYASEDLGDTWRELSVGSGSLEGLRALAARPVDAPR